MSKRVLKSLNLNGPKCERKKDQPPKNVRMQAHPETIQSNKFIPSMFASKENVFLSATKQELKGHSSVSTNPHKVTIFNEEKNKTVQKMKKKYKSTETQTDQENAKELMCSEEPTAKYWELLAEQRRKALADALDENQRLAEELEAKKAEFEEMKLEKERLEEVASDPHYLLSVINELMRTDQLRADEILVPVNSPQSLSDDDTDLVVSGSLENNKDENIPQRRHKLSEESCSSHDSDKENKPPVDHFLPLSDKL